MFSIAEKRAKEQFTEFLREGNYRITGERFEVLASVLKYDEHFDADSLYLRMRAEGAKVSRATVYKTLALLHECGLVSRFLFAPGDVAQYEKTYRLSTARPSGLHQVRADHRVPERQRPLPAEADLRPERLRGALPHAPDIRRLRDCRRERRTAPVTSH